MSHTKETIQTVFDLSDEDFKLTLRAVGIHPNKKNFSEDEYHRIEDAQQMLEDGTANSYDDIAAHFKQDASPQGAEADLINMLDRQTVQKGVEIGSRQAEILGQVIPQATMARLQQKIQSGELNQTMETYWNAQMGESPDVTTLMAEFIEIPTSPQLSGTTPNPTMNLLESSTESSESESDLP